MYYIETQPTQSNEVVKFIAKGLFFHNPGKNVDYGNFKRSPLFGLQSRGTLEIGTVFEEGINLVIFIPSFLQNKYLDTPSGLNLNLCLDIATVRL